jgi:trehalose 6-phosphate phosphatase
MNFADLLFSSTALFLDFDGTLVDIADQPDQIEVPASLVPTLQSLTEYLGGAVAVISGRPIAQIDDFLKPLQLATAGVHGTERRSAGGALELLSTHPLDLIEEAAHALAARNPGLLVESKRGSVALHYRQAPQLETLCLEAMREAVQASPGVTLLQGKMVVEAKPGGASKGGAIGDDITDEVGFASVQRIGGIGVKVGAGPSVAWQRIATPGQFRQELIAAVATRTGKAVA